MRKLLLLLVLTCVAGFAGGASKAHAGTPSCPVDEYGNCMPDYGSGGAPTVDSSSNSGWDFTCRGWQYYVVWKLHRGTWPYYQDLYLHTRWCGTGTGGVINSHGSWVTTGSFLCSSHDPYTYAVSGGNGYTQVTKQGGAYFDCPTPYPWITYHFHRWMQIRYYPGGGSTPIAWG